MDTNHFKQKLLEEKQRLLSELKSVGRENPDTPGDWEATPGDTGQEADPNDAADQMEEFGERVALEDTFEKRMQDVTMALARIEDGTFGTCSDSGSPHQIEEERLEANPAATTCMAHMH